MGFRDLVQGSGGSLVSRGPLQPNIRALRKIEIREPQYGPLSSHGSEVPVD